MRVPKSDAAVMTRAVLRLSRVVESELKALDLTPGQYRVLAQLDAGASNPSIVATQLAIRRPTFSATADVLVQRGLASRRTDPSDRRRTTYALTAEGRATLGRAEGAVARRLAGVATELGDRAEEARQALSLWHDALGRASSARWRRRRRERATPSRGKGVEGKK
jgi:DNA-binding MarR family transcriptional regulator